MSPPFTGINHYNLRKKFCKFSDTENEVDLILSRAGIFKTPKDIDDLTICPTHRSNLGVGWSRGSNSRCRVPKEVFGHGEGRVKSIPKGDRGIGKRVSRIILQVSANSYNLAPVSTLLTTVCKITPPVRLKSRLGIGQ